MFIHSLLAFYFEKNNECNILNNNLLQTLPELRKEYTVSFKLKPNSYSKGWKSVLHLTLGNDYGTFGDRNPGVWFHEDGSGKLSIFGAVNNDVNYYVETAPLPLGEWSYIKIYQHLLNGVYLYSVDLNGKNIHNVENSKATVLKNVKVYAGDPWYNPQDGSIKDLTIFNGNAGELVYLFINIFHVYENTTKHLNMMEFSRKTIKRIQFYKKKLN